MLDVDSGEQINALYKMYRIKGGKKEDYSGRDIYAVFSLGVTGQLSTTTDGENATPENKMRKEHKLIGYNIFNRL